MLKLFQRKTILQKQYKRFSIFQNSSKSNSQVKSFAETIANSATLKIDQAIVMNSVDGFKQIQYIIVLNKITDATVMICVHIILSLVYVKKKIYTVYKHLQRIPTMLKEFHIKTRSKIISTGNK